ncbi:MAG: FHA domain-containing protein [Deltaproteobacteria bacterium]|nr:FHA domain-containing protein [Deltaproteobacteria bacterium]
MTESSHNTSVAFSVYDGDALLSTETLSQEIIKIGRLQTSDIRLDDEKVSRMHAVIEVTAPGEVFIIDLGSASGTLVNGEKINKRKLQTGDQVQIGNKRLHLDIITGTVAVASSPPVAMAVGAGRATPVVDERAMAAMLDEQSEPRAKAVPKVTAKEDESGPKFNPFDAGAKRKSRTPFAHGAPEEGPEYGIVATTAALPSHEIETNERAIEVSVIWGDRNVLNVDYLTPPRDYYVGEPNGEDVDFVLGHDAIGVDRMPLCVAQGAGVAAIIPEGATGEATIGDQTRSFDLMRGQGDFQPSSTVQGAMEFPVPEGGSVRMKHRDFTFIVPLEDRRPTDDLRCRSGAFREPRADDVLLPAAASAGALVRLAEHRLAPDPVPHGARRARRAGTGVAQRRRFVGRWHGQGSRGRTRSDG